MAYRRVISILEVGVGLGDLLSAHAIRDQVEHEGDGQALLAYARTPP